MAACAVSCTPRSDEPDSGGRAVIHYWEKWTGFEADAMQAVVDDFNTSQNRIEVRMLNISLIDQKLMLAAAGGNPPDIAGIWSSNIPDFSEKGALTPLGGRLERAGITGERYIPSIWELCQHRGFTWALPISPATVGLHWNKRLFRDAGLDPDSPPTSLAELDRFAEQLTVVEVDRDGERVRLRYPELTDAERAEKEFDIIQIGHLPQEPGWWLEQWCWWFGGDLWDGERTITASSPGVEAAYRWIGSYVDKYGVDNLRKFGAAAGNFASPQNPFLEGRVAMVIQGVWMNNFIQKYAPHLEWDAAPFPSSDPVRAPNVTIVESDVLVIPRGAKRPDEAFEFIRYVNTQPALEKLNLGQRKFSPLLEHSDDFAKRHANPAIEVFIELAKSPQARHVPRLSMWLEYKSELLVAGDRVLADTASPAEALDDVQQRVSWKFDRVMRRWDAVREKRLEEWRSHDTR